MDPTNDDILQAIRRGDRTALGTVYTRYRTDFVRFARRYGCTDERALDVWQDAVIALYENATSGRLTQLTAGLKTYLFSIGKYALIDDLRRKQRAAPEVSNGMDLLDVLPAERIQAPGEANEELDRAVSLLGEPCRRLLTLFYYEGFAVEAIAERMGYANENTVSANKSRCLRKLRTLFTQQNGRHAE